jgi:hypothetical protein
LAHLVQITQSPEFVVLLNGETLVEAAFDVLCFPLRFSHIGDFGVRWNDLE